MAKPWSAEGLLELVRGYQAAAVLTAAAELELFAALDGGPVTAKEVADKLETDLRGTTILLDALAAVELIEKDGQHYSAAEDVLKLLARGGRGSVLAMMQHQANCLRRWSELARVVKAGRPLPRQASIRGQEADSASFIEAMDNICAPVAERVVGDLGSPQFKRLVDVGGASGTWTAAFLKECPTGRATIFDLPHVIPMARKRIAELGLGDRVDFAAGDFLADPLPRGADLAWVSAIVHQNPRKDNVTLFRNVAQALVPGGRVLVRDVVMEPSRTQPVAGALFAVNMLTGTESGGTYTLKELREDLASAGFTEVRLVREDEGMNAVVGAELPA